MFERYTEGARRVIFFGRFEAMAFGKTTIETEHLLLGVVREGLSASRRLVPGLPSTIEEVRKDAAKKNPPADHATRSSTDLPLSNEGKHVLAHAAQEAERLEDRQIRVEHILLGLLREEQSVA